VVDINSSRRRRRKAINMTKKELGTRLGLQERRETTM
jgi:hypothetical protein